MRALQKVQKVEDSWESVKWGKSKGDGEIGLLNTFPVFIDLANMCVNFQIIFYLSFRG